MNELNRRTFFQRLALIGGACIYAGCAQLPQAPASNDAQIRLLPARSTWAPAPAQAPAQEGIAALPGGAQLYYWDTGGTGEAVILLHAYTGNAAFWEYQQPALAAAGYRAIGYSRRGHYRSEPPQQSDPGTGVRDLHELADHLGIERFHLVATAAGGFIAFDYALSHPERLRSLVVANSLGGIQDDSYRSVLQHLLPASFSQLPADFRELGPSYRGAYRPGVERWLELHELGGFGRQPGVNQVTWAAVETLRMPILLLTGDADLYMPPSSLREFVRHLPAAEAAIITEVGHSAYWEQPAVFNEELLRFLRKHRAR